MSFKKLLPSFYRFQNGVRYPGFSSLSSFLFENFRIGACLSDKDCGALITLFML